MWLYDLESGRNLFKQAPEDDPRGLGLSELGYQFLNKFNNEVKFGRAYIDRDGDVAIQMDRNSAGGVSAENIESDFDVFLLLIAKFLSDLESQTVA